MPYMVPATFLFPRGGDDRGGWGVLGVAPYRGYWVAGWRGGF